MVAGAEEIGEAHGLAASRRRRAYPMCSCFAPLEEVLGGGPISGMWVTRSALPEPCRSPAAGRVAVGDKGCPNSPEIPAGSRCSRANGTQASPAAAAAPTCTGGPRATWAAHTRSFRGNRWRWPAPAVALPRCSHGSYRRWRCCPACVRPEPRDSGQPRCCPTPNPPSPNPRPDHEPQWKHDDPVVSGSKRYSPRAANARKEAAPKRHGKGLGDAAPPRC